MHGKHIESKHQLNCGMQNNPDQSVYVRLGELVWPDDPALQSYCSITLRHAATMNDAHYSFHLPWGWATSLTPPVS